MHMSDDLQQIIAEYTNIPSIESILLIGSRATPYFDRHSDYDLYIVYSGSKPTKSRRSRLSQIRRVTDFQFAPNENTWHDEWILTGESFSIDKIKIETGYQSVDFLKSVVTGVVKEGKTSLDIMRFRPYTILGLLEESKLLFDRNDRIRKLRKSIRPFPPELKRNLVQEGKEIISESLDDLKDYCDRSIGNNAFLFHLWRISGAFCQMVFALNEKYDTATKRVEHNFPNMKIKPKSFEQRFGSILEGPFDQSGRRRTVREIRSLFHDLTSMTDFQKVLLMN